jgi:hypothetical protein
LLAELGDSSVATLERRVAFTAGDGGLDAALHLFDKQLWPLVSADGERLIVERWRRLRTLLIPEPDEGETPTATIHS